MIPAAELKAIPAGPIPTDKYKRAIGDIPFLAVKYRLKGVSLKHQPDDRSIPQKYPFYMYYGQKYWVDIYSTYSGEYVKVDVYQNSNETTVDKSLNYKLIGDENGFCEQLEENAADVRDNNVWSGRSSESSGTDSGRDTMQQSPGRVKNHLPR